MRRCGWRSRAEAVVVPLDGALRSAPSAVVIPSRRREIGFALADATCCSSSRELSLKHARKYAETACLDIRVDTAVSAAFQNALWRHGRVITG